MRRALLIVVVLVVYVSLYPGDFSARELPASPLRMLAASWPAHLDRFTIRDVLANVLLYVPVGFLAAVALGPLTAALLALLLSGAIEILQLFTVSRTASALDILSNVAGAAVGIAIRGTAFARRLGRVRPLATHHAGGPTLLLACWIGYQVFPPIPLLGFTRLWVRWQAFWSTPSFSWVEALAGVVDWLAAARLLDVLYPNRLLILMALVPARMFIAARPVTWSELAAIAGAFLIWSFVRVKRIAWLAWLSAGALLLRGLAPFDFAGEPGPFSWIPFAASMDAERGSALIVLFRKTFLNGAAAWLFRRAGYGYAACASALAGLALAIEVAQLYLPGRSAEITDPLLVLAVAAVLALLESRRAQTPVRK